MENKVSKVLTVVGIVVAIIGCIVLMNAFQDTQTVEKTTTNAMDPTDYSVITKGLEKQNEMLGIKPPQENPFSIPIIIIVSGAGLCIFGLYNSRARKNNLPSGIG